MKIIANLKTQDDHRQPYWIFAFAVYSLSYRKSNFDENASNLVIIATIDYKLLEI